MATIHALHGHYATVHQPLNQPYGKCFWVHVFFDYKESIPFALILCYFFSKGNFRWYPPNYCEQITQVLTDIILSNALKDFYW
jgi:hypothetical protein